MSTAESSTTSQLSEICDHNFGIMMDLNSIHNHLSCIGGIVDHTEFPDCEILKDLITEGRNAQAAGTQALRDLSVVSARMFVVTRTVVAILEKQCAEHVE